ncbi:MAG: hypothetical protein VR68_15610 [Peptococcaceae bacterium BRH_c4a]|nr:MAG: hypothetical protein VR68_15610 [Peptococcaceae bacterium BRH_c4a]
MFKGQDSQKGIALLTVMVIMSVLVITGTLLLRMASSESRIIDNYGDNARAFYVAEAGADLAIKQWKDYVASLPPLVNADGSFTGDKADITAFMTRLDGTPKDTLEQKIRGGYLLASNSATVTISFSGDPASGSLDITQTADTPYFLNLTVTGNYGNASAEQKVRLWYYRNRTAEAYKGNGAPVINPPPPDTFVPPIRADSWTNTDTNQTDTRWTYNTTTDTISRIFESGNSDSIYTNTVLTAPYNLNMHAQFILGSNSSKWPGSELRVGLGYIPESGGTAGTSELMVALTIVEVGNSPKVSLTIRDGNNSNITVPVNFTRTLDASSNYQIQVSSQNNNLSINISDNTGQTFNYTSATTLRPGRLILIDGTNSHTDPRFTFPQ